MNLEWSKLIPASAGSGKTFTLMRLLQRGLMGQSWSAEDAAFKRALPDPLIPERIVAVTFTEAAANELQQRIRGALLGAGQTEMAARLEEAYVSTIHSLGLRLLRETAFDRGAALSPRLLSDDEQGQLLRRALGQSAVISSLTRDLARYGYRYSFGSGASAEDHFRADVLRVISLLEFLGHEKPIEEINEAVDQTVVAGYGPTDERSSEELAQMLKRCVMGLLEHTPLPITEPCAGNKSATETFQKNHDALSRAANTDALQHDWALWKTLGSLRQSKQGCATPEGYDELAQAVMDAAQVLHQHPGPLTSAREHIRILLLAAHDAMQHYADFKREAGLLDYSDMVAEAYRTVSTPALGELAGSRIDCVVVDEFQDTNPLQFGLLWKLIQSQVPTVIVGDLKQSIMGFQGADPRLFEALIDAYPELVQPLDRNWRSQPRLMAFINAISGRLFPSYRGLEAKGKEAALPPLHVLVMPDEKNKRSTGWHAARVAEAIANKLGDSALTVIDRHTEERRPLRGSDCAVLCPTHALLRKYASALRDQGVAVRLKEQGWLESPEVRMAMEALAFLHDPMDRHARLYLSVTALGTHSMKSALACLLNGQELTDPCLESLLALAERAQRSTVDQIVPQALERVGLFGSIALWPDARQARANLLRLEGLAKEFVELQPESRMAAGIYGTGLPQFLCWVRQHAERDDAQPVAAPVDENAVELVTWHASKGREWPLVAVCGWSQSVSVNLPDLRLQYPDFDDLDAMLTTAEMVYSPSFASPEATARFADKLQPDHERQILREIYVALTRPRDQLLLEWPLRAVDPELQTRAGLLQRKIGLQLEQDAVVLADGERFDAVVEYADAADGEDDEARTRELCRYGRRALTARAYHGPLDPDSRSPSTVESAGGDLPDFDLLVCGQPLDLPSHPDPTAVGHFVHRCFEWGFSRPRAIEQLEVEAKALWADHHEQVIAALKNSVAEFELTLREQLGVTALRHEVPVLGLDAAGTVVNGVVDLLAETPGRPIIIDHKSDRETDAQILLARHCAQLRGYAELMPEARLAIHAVRSAELILWRDGVGNVT